MFFALSLLASILSDAQAGELLPSSSVLIESNGKMMRKEMKTVKQESGNSTPKLSTYLPFHFTGGPPPNERHVPPPTEDIFDIAKELECNGTWNYYFLDNTPMTYRLCSNRCREIIECIGFDWGFDTCRLFTQKAVDVRRWKVHFNETTFGPYGGDGVYVQTTSQLGVLKEEIDDEQEKKGCYLRKNPLEPDAYYRKVGLTACTGHHSELKHYVAELVHGGRHHCEEACDKIDECIGLEFEGNEVEEKTPLTPPEK